VKTIVIPDGVRYVLVTHRPTGRTDAPVEIDCPDDLGVDVEVGLVMVETARQTLIAQASEHRTQAARMRLIAPFPPPPVAEPPGDTGPEEHEPEAEIPPPAGEIVEAETAEAPRPRATKS
jgi:hypothetical protein